MQAQISRLFALKSEGRGEANSSRVAQLTAMQSQR